MITDPLSANPTDPFAALKVAKFVVCLILAGIFCRLFRCAGRNSLDFSSSFLFPAKRFLGIATLFAKVFFTATTRFLCRGNFFPRFFEPGYSHRWGRLVSRDDVWGYASGASTKTFAPWRADFVWAFLVVIGSTSIVTEVYIDLQTLSYLVFLIAGLAVLPALR